MTAYDQDKLDAVQVLETASHWRREGVLDNAEWEQVKAANPPNLYIPNLFVRIGLGIFTLILWQSVMGFCWLIFEPENEGSYTVFFLIFGCMALFGLEKWVIRHMRHYASGVDDLTLYYGSGLILAAFFVSVPSGADTMAYAFIAFPILLIGAIRYLDRLMAAGAFLDALLILLLAEKTSPDMAPYLMPLTGMAYSACVYWFAKRTGKRYSARHWYKVLTIIELLALLVFYISGNYWVIQQAGAELFQMTEVPMGGFFWFFTFAVPLVYIQQGLHRKDRLLLDIGMGCSALAVFTFRYYFHVLPLSWAAAAGGALLFAGAYFAIRHLRKGAGAYTYEPDSKTFWLQELEEQLIEQSIANQPSSTPDKSGSFGGGQMGGGGASGEF